MFIKQIITGLCALSLSFTVFAADQAIPNTPHAAPTGGLLFAFGRVSIDSVAAGKENIKDSGSYIRLGAESIPKPWFFGGGISGIFYSDKVGFSQTVKDQYGTISNAKSSASSTNLFGEAGYSYSLADHFKVELLAGYEFVLSSSRSIDNCTDCASQDIKIDAGLYLTPRIKLAIDNYSISLSVQQFLTGDVKNALFLGLGLTL